MGKDKGSTASQEPSHNHSFLDMWTAWFNCVPVNYILHMPVSHWLKYKILVIYVLFVVLPLSGLSWAHIAGLLTELHPFQLEIKIGVGIFMAGGTGLMDAMLCGVIGQPNYSVVTWAVLFFRWGIALCTASILSAGAVLFMLDPQADRERDNQKLNVQHTDYQKLREIHALDTLESAKLKAAAEVTKSRLDFESTPSAVSNILSSHENCLRQLRTLEDVMGQRIPGLLGSRAQLTKEMQGNESAELAGRLKSVEGQIHSMHAEISRKRNECSRLKNRADSALQEHLKLTRQEMEAAQKQQKEADTEARVAQSKAKQQMAELNASTEKAWSKNFSAQTKAAWSLVRNDWSAMITAILIFVVALINELSPMLGKLALHNGPLDQRTAFEEERARQILKTQMATIIYQQEAERAVLQENLLELAELKEIRRSAQEAMRNASELHSTYEEASKNDAIKDVMEAIFRTAKAKMIDQLPKVSH